jgi:hypothetical protein
MIWNLTSASFLDKDVATSILGVKAERGDADAVKVTLIALSQARPYVAAPPRSKPDFGPWFGRWPSRLGAFPSRFFDAVGRA